MALRLVLVTYCVVFSAFAVPQFPNLGTWHVVLQDTAPDETPANLDEKPPALPEDTFEWDGELTVPPEGFSQRPIPPDDNPLTLEKIALGRRLFFDPVLSRDNTVACASCHRPDQAFADGEKVAKGIVGRQGTRNVPTVLNRGYGRHFFWDGRAATLEDQVLFPIKNPLELDSDIDKVIARLRQDSSYVEQFAEAFPNQDRGEHVVSETHLAQAIASFERILIYGNTKVDRFRSSEYSALSREARQGMWIFESRGGCWKCHGGENFTDEEFHNTGVSFGQADRDRGRYEETQNEADLFRFKTPTLRAIPLTAPYMHDGSQKTLQEVVEFYNKGGAVDDPRLDRDLKPLNLSDEEVGFLVAFLEALAQ